MLSVNEKTCGYCFLDLDVDNHRRKLAIGAAFVDATDSRYGFSSKDLRLLGGSELSRIHGLISVDHGACVVKVLHDAGMHSRRHYSHILLVLRTLTQTIT